ncbi:DUF2622 domain-containing protein [Burkholderia lata]|uniref:DUF2622 domain-containing protein n=1 Tax=Burkholderia lata (strain ATCC 17760 / DSM 23089 / LMG 22485 / NCIMB 9086 / R18194 / 383) TaxID=482957 RepID=UPI001453319F|nr:DUF2622 domain-containing protein [Burkholderia lata]VWB98029.1 hypothetical protein BLA15816_04738 [Burkholderia lata]
MAEFTTRVELHKPKNGAYDELHAEMEAEGFSRTWKTDDGLVYHLPTAEYDYRGEKTRQQVLDLAIKAAGRVQTDFEVFVTESRGRTGHNLTAK